MQNYLSLILKLRKKSLPEINLIYFLLNFILFVKNDQMKI